MALSELELQTLERRVVERLLRASQEWADATLRQIDGRDVPYTDHRGDVLPSTIEYALNVKAVSVHKLARLRAGEPLGDVLG